MDLARERPPERPVKRESKSTFYSPNPQWPTKATCQKLKREIPLSQAFFLARSESIGKTLGMNVFDSANVRESERKQPCAPFTEAPRIGGEKTQLIP